MTKDYFRSRKCILFWTGKPGGCVSSGSVESRLTWPLFGHLDTCLNSIVARGAKGCALWCFFGGCHYWAWIAKQMGTDEIVL